MKPYTLLKRSKLNPDVFALVRDNEVLVSFKPSKLYAAFETISKGHDLKEVDVVWRDGTRTVEHLVVHRIRKYVNTDTIMNYYTVCLMLRAQGAAVSLSVPVDIRTMFDSDGPLISEIHIEHETADKLAAALAPKSPAYADAHDGDEDDDDDWADDEDDVVDEDYEDEDDLDLEALDPSTERMLISSWGYRAEDWAVTLTDDQVQEVHSLEVGVDPDIELPLAPDAKDKYF